MFSSRSGRCRSFILLADSRRRRRTFVIAKGNLQINQLSFANHRPALFHPCPLQLLILRLFQPFLHLLTGGKQIRFAFFLISQRSQPNFRLSTPIGTHHRWSGFPVPGLATRQQQTHTHMHAPTNAAASCGRWPSVVKVC